MVHAYPKDLAAFVLGELQREGQAFGAWDVALPSLETLTELFSVAYQAGLRRDEERMITFRIAFAPPDAFPEDSGPPRGVHRLRFLEPRPYDPETIRRLAPAARFHRSMIGVNERPGSRALETWGILHTGPAWLRAVQGGRGREPFMPPVLTLAMTGPGRIVVTRGLSTIARLSGGHVTTGALDVFHSDWLHEVFAPLAKRLVEGQRAARAARDLPPVEVDEDLVQMIAQHFVRRVVATIRVAHHGGTILFVPDEPDARRPLERHLLANHLFRPDEPRTRFVSLVRKVLDRLAEKLPHESIGWREYSESDDPDLVALDNAIFELAHEVAGFADVDGAVVLTQSFEILGFGAEIVGDLPEVSHVLRVTSVEGDVVPEPVTMVGTRHRSVYRFCRAYPTSFATVISQDGTVRFVSGGERGVSVWEQVTADGPDV